MCDYFWPRIMEKSRGDLTDIFRGSGLAGATTSASHDAWQPPPDPATDGFSGDFADTKDLMLHELAGTGFFGSAETAITAIRQPAPPLVGLTSPEKVSSGAPSPPPRTPVVKRRRERWYAYRHRPWQAISQVERLCLLIYGLGESMGKNQSKALLIQEAITDAAVQRDARQENKWSVAVQIPAC